ncbi:MAG: hypothetical protein ACKO2P_01360 [Planctomycetota bacterium]
MKLKTWMLSAAVPAVLGLAVVAAQPPGDESRPPGPPEGAPRDNRGPGAPGEGRGRRPPNPLSETFDADRNGEISPEEIASAADALKKLDANNDGKLTPDELRPPGPPPGGPEGRGPDGPDGRPPGPPDGEGRPPGGRGRPPGGPEGPDGPDGRPPGPPDGEGRPPGGRGRPPGGPEGPDRPNGRPPGPPDGEGRPPGGPEGRGGREGRPPGGPMNPERFADEALTFDSDGDGKLDRAELMKFAQTRPGMGAQPARPGMGRGERGGQPERPRRPEAE